MQTPGAFEERYQKLNAEQQEAVDTIDGPVMVIAGPGTGKTQILTLRIANILQKTDLPPEAILALTFTEAGAAEMRRRLADIIGEAAYRVRIATFHGFANDMIQRYPEHFPRLVGARPISETDRVKLVESLLLELPLKLLRPFGDPLYYLRPAIGKLDAAKREGWNAEDFKKLIEEKLEKSQAREDRMHVKGAHAGKVRSEVMEEERRLERLLEFASLYAAYQERLGELRAYDFADMLLELVSALEGNEDFLRTIQEQNQYVLVDEHQDTNWAQNRAIELILDYHENPNLFIVGDEKQAIYRFQGASLDNFRYFEKKFSGTRLISLKENYRSGQGILDASHGIAKTITDRAAVLSGNRGAGNRIAAIEFDDPDAEMSWIARDIAERLAHGEEGREIAVLYRNNSDGFDVAAALRAGGVPHRIESKGNILDDRFVRRLLIQLDAAADFGNPHKMAHALHAAFVKFDALDLYRVIATRNIVETVRSAEALHAAGVLNPEAFTRWAFHMSGWEALAKRRGLAEAVATAFRESGLIAELLARPDPEAELEKARTLLAAAKEFECSEPAATIHSFLEHIDTLRKNGFELEAKVPTGNPPGKVRLMTAHQSKGQEFGTVYVCRATDARWGGRKKGDPLAFPSEVYRSETASNDASDDDERRLFYVALTRAKEMATVTYAKADAAGRENLPLRFLGEIEPALIDRRREEAYESDYRKAPEFVHEAPVESREGEREFVRNLFESRDFPVTHLNNYLTCPWKYFYINLLRIPEVENRYMAYGTAVHVALRRFFEMRRKGEGNELDLVRLFTEELPKTKIAEQDYEDALRRGTESLAGWYAANNASWPREAMVERKISGVSRNGIGLTGTLDKIEDLPSGGVRVIDYKTSKPKSRNELLGKTKEADGNYLRQLAFYRLLLENTEGGKHRMEEGMIDFVEPNDTGKYRTETFGLDEIPYEKMLEELDAAIHDIRTFGFENRFCDDPKCEYCALRKMAIDA